MRAYASMYRLFRPTVISGHTRLISGHTRLISGHTRLISGHRRQRPIIQYRMRRDLTYTIVKFWSSSDLCAALRETLRGAETAALRETWCRNLTAVVLTQPQGISSYHIRLCYSHKIRYIIICHALYKSLYIYTYGQSGRR